LALFYMQREEEISVIEKMITKSGRMLKENGGYVNIADLAGETLGGKGFEFIS